MPSQQLTVGSTEVRASFSDWLKRVHAGKEHLVVQKGGIPVAALIGMREYEAFQRWQAADSLHRLGTALGAQARRAGIDEQALHESLEEDRAAVYRAIYES